MGWWPFLGETLNFLKPHESNSLGSFLQERCSRYGRVFKSHLFGYPTIVSCDFELNMFILQNEGKLFPVDYPKVMHKILGKFSLLLNKGEHHKKLRSTVISFVSASKCESNFIHSVEMLVLSRINSWGSNCTQVAFYKEAKRFSINVMLTHLLNINPDEPIASKILENFENYIKGFISLPLNIPGTTYFKAVKARIRLSSIIKDIIIERRSKVDNVVEGGDLLNLILSKQNLCDEERIGIVLDLLFGGYETTSKLLSMIVYFLDGAPNLLHILQEEHEVIRKSKMEGELLNWEDYKQMEFTQNVIYEAMRCGIVIPAGWKVFPVLSAPHLDPNRFENPLEFNPFRWNEDNSTSQKVAPFGGGPRFCPGADLAKVEIAFFLHHLVLNYR
ncbi:cytochrome P450 724B1 [Trifolium pratense]|uniref:cytochrome P450 724B1 n=1 Tax=Trifolium pratense TaxID=57577 RepID=UPI001E693AE2|nr:cytochrome P450 724B1 [Trifolium pratense]